MTARTVLLTLVLVLGFGSASVAETIAPNNLRQAQAAADNRPVRGMSMETVEARYGPPVSKRDAVGDPPITRWEYADFVVYFEYKYVIHAVQKNRKNS